jgi:hypothetical protein
MLGITVYAPENRIKPVTEFPVAVGAAQQSALGKLRLAYTATGALFSLAYGLAAEGSGRLAGKKAGQKIMQSHLRYQPEAFGLHLPGAMLAQVQGPFFTVHYFSNLHYGRPGLAALTIHS